MGMTAVYGILCLANRKMYIGQSTNVKSRWNNHQYKLRKGEHYAERLQKAWNRYGKDMFKLFIIEECSPESVYGRELHWIKKLMTYKPSIGFNRHWKEAKRQRNGAQRTD